MEQRPAFAPGFGGREFAPGKATYHISLLEGAHPLKEQPRGDTQHARQNAKVLDYWKDIPRVDAKELARLQKMYESGVPAGAVAGHLPGGEKWRARLNKSMGRSQAVVLGTDPPSSAFPSHPNIEAVEEKEWPKARGIPGYGGHRPRHPVARPSTASLLQAREERPPSPPRHDLEARSWRAPSQAHRQPSFGGDVSFFENGREMPSTTKAAKPPHGKENAPSSSSAALNSAFAGFAPSHGALPPKAQHKGPSPAAAPSAPVAAAQGGKGRGAVTLLNPHVTKGVTPAFEEAVKRSYLVEKAQRRSRLAPKINHPLHVPKEALPAHYPESRRAGARPGTAPTSTDGRPLSAWRPSGLREGESSNGAARNVGVVGRCPFGTLPGVGFDG